MQIQIFSRDDGKSLSKSQRSFLRNELHQAMECRACNVAFDESMGIPTDTLGDRLCPKCRSSETYVL